MTVAQALAAHAAAQMSAAEQADQAQSGGSLASVQPMERAPSFAVSWAVSTMVIGQAG